MNICEAIRELNKLDNPNIPEVNITVILSTELNEGLSSGNIEDEYDDQTVEDWYNFLGNVEEIIESEHNYEIADVATSTRAHQFSHYIDFFTTEDKECVVNLRISDNASTTSIKGNRKRHLQARIKDNYNNCNYKLLGVTVDNNRFNTCDEALDEIRRILKTV